MPPFSQFPLITGFKDKVDALHLAGEWAGRADGRGSLSLMLLCRKLALPRLWRWQPQCLRPQEG